MGIKDINKSLRKYAPNAFVKFPLNKAYGNAIGIDANGWLFKTKSAAMKDVLRITHDPLQALDEQKLIESMIQIFYKFIYNLCQNGITPVWIFDGEKHPCKLAVERRRIKKDSLRLDMETERKRLLEMDPLSRKSELNNVILLLSY